MYFGVAYKHELAETNITVLVIRANLRTSTLTRSKVFLIIIVCNAQNRFPFFLFQSPIYNDVIRLRNSDDALDGHTSLVIRGRLHESDLAREKRYNGAWRTGRWSRVRKP